MWHVEKLRKTTRGLLYEEQLRGMKTRRCICNWGTILCILIVLATVKALRNYSYYNRSCAVTQQSHATKLDCRLLRRLLSCCLLTSYTASYSVKLSLPTVKEPERDTQVSIWDYAGLTLHLEATRTSQLCSVIMHYCCCYYHHHQLDMFLLRMLFARKFTFSQGQNCACWYLLTFYSYTY
jgi:hypothetical protein